MHILRTKSKLYNLDTSSSTPHKMVENHRWHNIFIFISTHKSTMDFQGCYSAGFHNKFVGGVLITTNNYKQS